MAREDNRPVSDDDATVLDGNEEDGDGGVHTGEVAAVVQLLDECETEDQLKEIGRQIANDQITDQSG